MGKSKKIQERFLYKIWKNQFQNRTVSSVDGNTILVIDPGVENQDNDGPDFINARVQIGNIKFKGDIEIDNFHSDWKSHGHNFNKKYNKVILHIVYQEDNNNNSVYSRDGRKITTIGIGKFIEGPVKDSIQKALQSERYERLNRIPCNEVSARADEKFKTGYIIRLGIERYKQKCERILLRLKELVLLKELNLKEPVVNYDPGGKLTDRKFSYEDFSDKSIWKQLFYELTFETLGYTNNKDIMKKLAQTVDINFLDKFADRDDFLKITEAALFNVSGLIPDYKNIPDEDISVYVRDMVESWESIKKDYDGKTFYKSYWHFAKLRPPNFPAVRIAGGGRIVQKILNEDLLYNIFQKFEETAGTGEITMYLRNNLIIKGEGFWHNHFQFGTTANSKIKYFVGLSRADDMIINVVFPVASLYFEIFGKNKEAKKVYDFYLSFIQKSENRLVNDLSNALELQKSRDKSVVHQGMINLYRNFCSRDKCLECEIGRRVFN